MSKKPRRATTATTAGNVPTPVRVRLRRINCDYARPYPPDGQAREWWQRLKNAFGSSSSVFVDASLVQLIAAARLPGSGISEIAVNASLAFIEGVEPQGEVESALAIQMSCTHAATMAVLGRLGGPMVATETLPRRPPRLPNCCAPTQPKLKSCAASGTAARSLLGLSTCM
jgi:hypothetical protein